ncbi:hypothetical protein GCM10009809_31240 [Isoptericola hypogeus]|uniref:Uncharacterized protein n=1 Tax=Isoptericola hypogeus TaxID=300179 RepID=A0ABP4VQY7_9MICO
MSTPTVPSPVTSVVLTAPVILVVDVAEVRVGSPAPDPADGRPVRTGAVRVEVVEVLKGAVAAEPGARVDVPVVLRSAADPWGTAAAGERLVAFCDGVSRDPAELLAAEHCLALVPDAPAAVADDVRLALSLVARHLLSDELLAEAGRVRADAGRDAAQVVYVLVREAVRTDPDRFDRLLAVAADPGTRVEAQEAYLVAAYEDATFTGAFSTRQRAALVRAMLSSALDPRLGDLRERLLGVYVPNLVRAPQPAPPAPGDVFGPEHAGLRAAVAAELADPRDPATTSPELAAWLAGSS